jgi:hypothetical protein
MRAFGKSTFLAVNGLRTLPTEVDTSSRAVRGCCGPSSPLTGVPSAVGLVVVVNVLVENDKQRHAIDKRTGTLTE